MTRTERLLAILQLLREPRLDVLVRDPSWRSLPDEDQQDAVDKLMKKARAEARAQLFAGGSATSGSGVGSIPALPPGLRLRNSSSSRPRSSDLPALPPGLRLTSRPDAR